MKVKYADRIYTVSDIKETGGLTWYGIEDEPNHIDWVHDVEIVVTRDEIINEAKNDYMKAIGAEPRPDEPRNNLDVVDAYIRGAEYAFDYALQQAKQVIIEHFGVDDKYADMVEELFNRLDERLGE